MKKTISGSLPPPKPMARQAQRPDAVAIPTLLLAAFTWMLLAVSPKEALPTGKTSSPFESRRQIFSYGSTLNRPYIDPQKPVEGALNHAFFRTGRSLSESEADGSAKVRLGAAREFQGPARSDQMETTSGAEVLWKTADPRSPRQRLSVLKAS